jgi:nicotinamidase-related amidase
VGGLATDYCVRNTARQLAEAGFTVIVNLSSCRAISEAGALETIQYFYDWRQLMKWDIWAVTDIIDYRHQCYRNDPEGYVPQISS